MSYLENKYKAMFHVSGLTHTISMSLNTSWGLVKAVSSSVKGT